MSAKMLPRLATAARQSSRVVGQTILAGGEQYAGSNFYKVGTAVVAGVLVCATFQESPANMGYGPIATIQDVRNMEGRISAVEADTKYPGRTINSAFVFVKPQAVTAETRALVEKKFRSFGVKITGSGTIDAKTIDEEKLIDTHYGAIAHKAMNLKPSELNVSDKARAEFKKAFGLEWSEAVEKGMVYNAIDGCKKMGCAPTAIDKKYWCKLEKGKNLIKFGGGFYCGQLADDVFVINGFYMAMRSVFTSPPAVINWYTVEWPASSLSWSDFRNKVLGSTDPKTADEGSIRRAIYDEWKTLKLKEIPNVGDNGVHASASPLEALSERINWLGISPECDSFGAACIGAGITADTLALCGTDPVVKFDGKPSSAFDLLEDMDAKDCIEKLLKIQKE